METRLSEFVNNHRSLQQIICLLVCVCAWRGPVPLLHDHDALANSQFRHEHSLAFHEGREVEETVGLHWHLAYPEDVTGEQIPARDETSQDLSLFACASAAASFESVVPLSMLFMRHASQGELDAFADIAICVRLPGATQPRSFLQTLLSGRPLTAVTGVCLI